MHRFWKGVGAAVVGITLGLGAAHAGQYDEAPANPEKPGCAKRDEPAPARGPAESRTTVRGVGNGTGNSIVIDNGGGGGTTVIENSRNGVGNRLVIVDGEVVTDVQAPAPPRGQAARFGEMRFYSVLHGAMLYWCPRTLAWYRYDPDQGRYVRATWDY
jgi:hypothetical protein